MRSLAALLPSLLLLAVLPASAQKKPVTLESLGAAMTRAMGEIGGQPLWAPEGKVYAVRRGAKVMLYDAAARTEKELFSTDEIDKAAKAPPPETAMSWENRRVREQPMQWSADGKKILLLLKGDIFLWDSAAGKAEQITATAEVAERDPKLSPDGTKVSFRRGRELYVADVATRKVTQLTFDSSPTRWNAMLDWVYPEELDLGTAHWWSPDSKSIAYLQFDVSRETLYPHGDHLPIAAVDEPQRYPKAGTPNADVRVGVVPAAGGETRWMDFGETRDFLTARVHWTPDSRRVVVHRLNRVQDHLAIMAADVSTGRATTLIAESDPAWINITDDFRFLSDGGILRTSEKDGFRHIYLHSAAGKEIARLTGGDWEVSAISCVDQAARRVFYTSTEASPPERHLYSVSFDGKDKRQLTKGEGTHAINMSPACDFYADSFSSLDSPSQSTLHRADGAQLAVLREADRKVLDEYVILKTEIHKFKGADGTLFYGRLIRPANLEPGKKYPVLVQIYGGPHAQSVRNAFSGISLDQALAQRGYVIWQMDNRGSSGRGHRFESPLYRRMGRQELEDQKEGIRYLLSLGFADPDRIAVNGWSYGGYMTLYCLLHAPEIFKAGIAGAAVTDWRNYDTIYTERYMGLPQENEQGYKDSSPVHAAANLKGKLLMLHNIEDDNVLFANFLQMTNAFQLADKPYQSILYPQKSHGVTGRARAHMTGQMVRFLDESLK